MSGQVSYPAGGAFEVTPHDTNDIQTTRALYIGVLGNVKVDMSEFGTAVTFVGVSGILPVRVTRVYATDTTATGIVGLV